MAVTEDTPLMQQWRDVKARHRDALVFFRVGDFYELFYGDAEEGSKLLGLTLTARNNGAASAVPLAGVPARAVDDYVGRLVRAGRRSDDPQHPAGHLHGHSRPGNGQDQRRLRRRRRSSASGPGRRGVGGGRDPLR